MTKRSADLKLDRVLLSDRVLANFVLDDERKICIAVAMEILSEEAQEKIGRTEIETLAPNRLLELVGG